MTSWNMSEDDYKGGEPVHQLGVGVHEVYISSAKMGKTDSGHDYMEVYVLGEDDDTDNARLWFTDKSAKYSIATLQGIFVHNAKDEAEKNKIKSAFIGNITLDYITKLIPKLKDKQCWFEVKDSGGTYEYNGKTYPELWRNIRSYKPAEKKTTVEDLLSKSEPVDTSDIPFN